MQQRNMYADVFQKYLKWNKGLDREEHLYMKSEDLDI